MKKLKERVLSLILVVSMVCALFPVSAGAYDYNPQKSKWTQFVDAFLGAVGSVFDVSVDASAFPDFTFSKTGSVTEEEVQAQCQYYNSIIGAFCRNFITGIQNFGSFGTAVPAYDSSNGIIRPQDKGSGEWIVDSNGEFPYFCGEGDVPAEMPDPSVESANRWIHMINEKDQINSRFVVVSHDALSETAIALNSGGHDCSVVKGYLKDDHTLYYYIKDPKYYLYCNSSGMPYVALAQSSATDIGYDYIINEDNSTTINDSQIIQIEDGILNIIDDTGDKIQLTIDSLTFDSSTKNYTVNAYNTVREGDNYYYTYYTYNITYNITNTYINYIGSNAAYEKEEYQYYYQLPDGRSSADLTADEVAGMSFEFHDVVNYAKSATDVSVRALYHFDGDTDDSSYFSTQGAFTWKEGASITYMEAPAAFDGALYLDTTAHAFDITLPSSLGSGDFTVQFRHYQASEPDTQDNINNSLSLGGNTVLKWDEQSMYYGSTKIAALPVGTWSEIALVRSSGRLYIYLNGLCIHSAAFTSALSNVIAFSLGETSRSFTMLDELRVVNFAVAANGASYTPTAVPYDSNLLLVLPDSARPVADEYWDIRSSGTNLLKQYQLDNWMDSAAFIANSFTSWGELKSFYSDTIPYQRYYSTLASTAPCFYYNTISSLIDCGDHASLISSAYSSGSKSIDIISQTLAVAKSGWSYFSSESLTGGLFFPLFPTWGSPAMQPLSNYTNYNGNVPYTFSLVDTDGNICSVTFTGEESLSSAGGTIIAEKTFGHFRMGFFLMDTSDADWQSGNTATFLTAFIQPLEENSSVDFVYLELVEGTSTDLTAEFVTCIYPEIDMQPNTAAVQSDIPVNGYTVGGVRPTLPARGDCWFPVSGGRIQTCYIYNGSMWEEVGCRWYTGSRWIPIYAFDLETLEDLFDIADAAEAVTPITSQEGFWRWWQLQWLDFREWLNTKFDALISAVGGTPGGSTSSCEHEYSSQVTTQPSCAQPGYRTYTCSKCGHQYTEIMDATGHDWICTNSVPDVLDEDGNVVEKGYDEMTCSVCGTTAKDYGNGPEENDLFDALGDFIADGISWVLDKLTELVDALTGITDTFHAFTEKIQTMAGDYPAFFGAFVALIPEELSALMWFAVTAFVVIAVWKKWSR